MRRVLFLDDDNYWGHDDPDAYLVEIPDEINNTVLKSLERQQPGAYRIGGKWDRIMEDGKISYTLISSGKKSDYKKEDYDEEYELISGNY